MAESLPVVLIPGLLASPRLYYEQMPSLWRSGPVMVADHTHDDSVAAMARRILATAPARFALVGHSMGGYIALEIMRQAAGKVAKLAMLNTAARPDTPEQSERRRRLIALAEAGRFAQIADTLFANLVHVSRQGDEALRRTNRLMAEETGPEAFVRQQAAIMSRPDSRPRLGEISCPVLVLVGDGDGVTPPERSEEMASAIKGARLVIVPECGHLSPLERPAEVAQALRDWVNGV